MEIEAKYQVDEADLNRIAALSELAPYRLRNESTEHQLNTYFDSADRRLSTARYGLRVRHIGNRSVVTLKGPGHVADDGIHRRAEWEFPGDDPSPLSWPAGPARELAAALLAGHPLQQLVTIATERRRRCVLLNGRERAELCLDRSTITAGGATMELAELEIELLEAGDQADITQLAAALRRYVTITPQPLSKLQRAIALLD
jgi:inorganic triphosphatase YgiF